MKPSEIENLIKELLEKAEIELIQITIAEEKPGSTWVSVDIKEPHLFTNHEGEGLHALSHLIHRIIEAKNPTSHSLPKGKGGEQILLDINGFQKKKVESVRAIAHMMSERARYFKSSIEVDPMSPFERRIVHEFLSGATDLKTESIGTGRSRRVVIRYTGNI